MAAKRETTAEAFEREIRFEEITVPVTALIANYIRKKTTERSIEGIAKPFPTQLFRVGARCLRCDAVFPRRHTKYKALDLRRSALVPD